MFARSVVLAARRGLEPPTFGLGNRCSILLSYRAVRRCFRRAAGPASSPSRHGRLTATLPNPEGRATALYVQSGAALFP